VERNCVDIAQHGYQHLLDRKPQHATHDEGSPLPPRRSEFAGYSFNEQLEKIQNGREILRARGLKTDYFFAPNHSFDFTTLRALRAASFTAVSDGCALKPYQDRGLVFVPQQLWQPRWMPTGVFTICLHSNEITPSHIRTIRRFLRTPARISSFSHEVRSYTPQSLEVLHNSIFWGLYSSARLVRHALGKRNNTMPRPPWLSPMTREKDSISSI
jgi:hypothetical protein